MLRSDSFCVTYNDMKSSQASPSRPYRQIARASAAQATAALIEEAFAEEMRHRWFDEITLEQVAQRAGVTIRTVIRRFSGKEGLLEAFVENFKRKVTSVRSPVPGDVPATVRHLMAVYEEWGDSVIRNLAQEQRHPALTPLLDMGRAGHRALTTDSFAPWLDRLPEPERRRTIDALVIVTDVYSWKLLRRDMRRSRKETEILLRKLIDGVLAKT